MDSRCLKFWEDGQALVAAAEGARAAQTQGKMLKELRTMSRFLQRNQSSRFSDAAQQKLVDCVGHYVAFSKPNGSEAVFQVVKDGLAMPFNVMGSKQKKRLLKWYNELISVVGGDHDAAGTKDTNAEQRVEWSVMDVDGDGYLSLVQLESGETSESFQVKRKSAEYTRIKKALEDCEVTVVTVGDNVVDIQVDGD